MSKEVKREFAKKLAEWLRSCGISKISYEQSLEVRSFSTGAFTEDNADEELTSNIDLFIDTLISCGYLKLEKDKGTTKFEGITIDYTLDV